jgi:hypothetical protein
MSDELELSQRRSAILEARRLVERLNATKSQWNREETGEQKLERLERERADRECVNRLEREGALPPREAELIHKWLRTEPEPEPVATRSAQEEQPLSWWEWIDRRIEERLEIERELIMSAVGEALGETMERYGKTLNDDYEKQNRKYFELVTEIEQHLREINRRERARAGVAESVSELHRIN